LRASVEVAVDRALTGGSVGSEREIVPCDAALPPLISHRRCVTLHRHGHAGAIVTFVSLGKALDQVDWSRRVPHISRRLELTLVIEPAAHTLAPSCIERHIMRFKAVLSVFKRADLEVGHLRSLSALRVVVLAFVVLVD
jgi:hypothetical protein